MAYVRHDQGLRQGEIVPRLVEEWDVDSAGLIYTFNLQEGAKWIDPEGRDWGEFNADDFIWSLLEVNRPGYNHGSRGIRNVFFCNRSVEDIYGAQAPATPTPELIPGEPTPFQHGGAPLGHGHEAAPEPTPFQHGAPAEPTPFQHGGGEEVEPTGEACQLTKIDDYTVQLTRPEPTFEITWHSRLLWNQSVING